MLMMADMMTELFQMQTQALQNLRIDKVLVMDGGKGDGVPNFVNGFAQSLPFAHEIAELGGVKLPGLFMGERLNQEETGDGSSAKGEEKEEGGKSEEDEEKGEGIL